MLGSNRPSDNQVEGCVEALSVSRCPRGELLSSGTVFPLRQSAQGGPIRITRWFSAFAIVPNNNRPPFPSLLRSTRVMAPKTPGVRGRAPEVRRCTVLAAGEARIWPLCPENEAAIPAGRTRIQQVTGPASRHAILDLSRPRETVGRSGWRDAAFAGA